MNLAELLEIDLEAVRETELAPVDVAILDTGIDGTHPDLAGRITAAYRIASEGGRPRLVEHEPRANNDLFGHGTGVASVVAAVAPNARILDIRIAEENSIGVGDSLVSAFGAAIQLGVPLVNLSLVCHRKFLEPLVQLCEVAYRRNQIVVAARKNIPLGDDGIPAEFSSCIGVDSDHFPSPYGFRFRLGHAIECTARGEQVVVAAPGGKYTVQTGTSYATPTMTGLCALLRGLDPGITPFEAKTVLRRLGSRPA